MSTSFRPSASHDDRGNAFARLFDALHEGVYIGVLARGPDGDITLAANTHLKTLFGYGASTPEADVLPFARPRFVDPDSRERLLQLLAVEGAVAEYPLRMRRADCSEVRVQITARATLMDAAWVQVEVLVRDLADDHLPYQELVHAERMASLGQMISGVAHELNNPLATILSWSERLADGPLDPVSRRGVGIITAEAQRAGRIVRNLLTFARKRQSTRTLVDVNRLVHDTLALRAHEQRLGNITLTTELAADLPEVFVDGHQIQQVILNLVINAEQAMTAANGRGTLALRTWHETGRNMVVLEVSDDGPGVAAEVRDRIFDPFVTTKNAGMGTGLGLTVAHAIVREHGGTLRVSRYAPGACFHVELPTRPAPPASYAAVPAQTSLDGRAVLLVEDERRLAAAISETLIDAGLKVDHAGDGEEALARMRQQTYDLVICDLQMPRLGGTTLYRAMAAVTPALARRVIFVTGAVAGTDAERFLRETGCRWLEKPFRFTDLLRAVRETLA